MKTELLSIQYLRGLAALAVVSYHAGQWVTWPWAVGAAGVDVFFVISGVVMWASTWGKAVAPGAFLLRRLTRVAPLYWVLTLALAAAATAAPGVFPHVKPEAGHILLSMLFIPHADPEGQIFPLLAVGWTLNYEMIFYLVFAAGLMLAPGRRLAWLAAVMLPLACAGLVYFPIYKYVANPMLLQFVAGVGLGRLWTRRALPGRRVGYAMIAAALALFAVTAWSGVVPDSLGRPFEWGVPALILVAGALSVEADGGLPRIGALGRLGDASYSIYLCHTSVIALINRATGPIDPVLFFTLAMALPTAAGLACHYGLERPLIGWARGLNARAPSPGTA